MHVISETAKKPRERCRVCAVEAVQRRRRKVKRMAVDLCGRTCQYCGLKSPMDCVYDFHHCDPSKKNFAISAKGHCRSWEVVKAELELCIMLCANCHRIRHSKYND